MTGLFLCASDSPCTKAAETRAFAASLEWSCFATVKETFNDPARDTVPNPVS